MPPLNPLKVVNLAPFARRNSPHLTWTQRLQGAMQYGWRWFREYPAQERLVELLREHLDRRFLVLLNFRPYQDRPPFPPILVGPSGVHLLYPTYLKGDFRVREDRLWVYDSGKQRYKPVRPDLVQELKALRGQLQNLLEEKVGDSVPEVEARLVFLDPASYVDVSQAEIQPIMVDGLPRYLEQLIRNRRYRRTQIQQWLEVFLHWKPAQAPAQASRAKPAAAKTPAKTAPARPAQKPQPRAPRAQPRRPRPPRARRSRQRLLFYGLIGLNLVLMLTLVLLALLLLRS